MVITTKYQRRNPLAELISMFSHPVLREIEYVLSLSGLRFEIVPLALSEPSVDELDHAVDESVLGTRRGTEATGRDERVEFDRYG